MRSCPNQPKRIKIAPIRAVAPETHLSKKGFQPILPLLRHNAGEWHLTCCKIERKTRTFPYFPYAAFVLIGSEKK